MKKAAILILILLIMAGCSKNEKADAYGTMSVSEIYPACEVTGKMISFTKNEGEKVTAGEVIALLDTTDIDLQINEMNTTIKLKRMALTSRENEILILTQEKTNLEIDKKRFEKLTDAQAAPEKNLDDVMAALRVLELKLKNADNTKQISKGEITLAEEKLEQLKARKEKCILRSPISGTILKKYIHEGEMALAGKPFCSIANLNKMTAKVYVSETQLPELTIGGEVTIKIDTSDGAGRKYSGKITHIAEQAEFTPKIIQTREERVKLVYEIEVDCLNDGGLKIGMPVEMYIHGIEDGK